MGSSYVIRDSSGTVKSASPDLKNYVGKNISDDKALAITSPKSSGGSSRGGSSRSSAQKQYDALTQFGRTGVPVVLKPGETYEEAVARSAAETADLARKAKTSHGGGTARAIVSLPGTAGDIIGLAESTPYQTQSASINLAKSKAGQELASLRRIGIAQPVVLGKNETEQQALQRSAQQTANLASQVFPGKKVSVEVSLPTRQTAPSNQAPDLFPSQDFSGGSIKLPPSWTVQEIPGGTRVPDVAKQIDLRGIFSTKPISEVRAAPKTDLLGQLYQSSQRAYLEAQYPDLYGKNVELATAKSIGLQTAAAAGGFADIIVIQPIKFVGGLFTGESEKGILQLVSNPAGAFGQVQQHFTDVFRNNPGQGFGEIAGLIAAPKIYGKALEPFAAESRASRLRTISVNEADMTRIKLIEESPNSFDFAKQGVTMAEGRRLYIFDVATATVNKEDVGAILSSSESAFKLSVFKKSILTGRLISKGSFEGGIRDISTYAIERPSIRPGTSTGVGTDEAVLVGRSDYLSFANVGKTRVTRQGVIISKTQQDIINADIYNVAGSGVVSKALKQPIGSPLAFKESFFAGETGSFEAGSVTKLLTVTGKIEMKAGSFEGGDIFIQTTQPVIREFYSYNALKTSGRGVLAEANIVNIKPGSDLSIFGEFRTRSFTELSKGPDYLFKQGGGPEVPGFNTQGFTGAAGSSGGLELTSSNLELKPIGRVTQGQAELLTKDIIKAQKTANSGQILGLNADAGFVINIPVMSQKQSSRGFLGTVFGNESFGIETSDLAAFSQAQSDFQFGNLSRGLFNDMRTQPALISRGRSREATIFDQSSRFEQLGRMDEIARFEQIGRTEQIGRFEQLSRFEQLGRFEQLSRFEQLQRFDQLQKTDVLVKLPSVGFSGPGLPIFSPSQNEGLNLGSSLDLSGPSFQSEYFGDVTAAAFGEFGKIPKGYRSGLIPRPLIKGRLKL